MRESRPDASLRPLDLGPPERILELALSLRGVDVLRAVLKKSFGLELGLASSEGPLAHQAGGVITGSSEVCRSALFSRAGFLRCDAHYRALAAELPSSGGRACHLGLASIAVPVPTDAPLDLVLFASGFAATHLHGCPPPDPARLAAGLVELDPNAGEAPEALRRLPVVRGDRVETVRNLLAAAAEELAVALDERVRRLGEAGASGSGPFGMIGRSPRMLEVFELLRRLVPSTSSVLVRGESGTGKELVARALHEHGPRRAGPFVAQACGALDDGTLEAALFGHTRGAFSGAVRAEAGLFGAAHRGTLFLDEVGEMSSAMQTKLLRVLSDGSYLPVGATTPRRADVRLVCATSRDLRAMVEQGQFREDLFYRLHVLSVVLPPLRERASDIAPLVEHFRASVEGVPPRLSEAASSCLSRYAWPGNVRELRAEVERWAIVATNLPELRPEHLSPEILAASGFAPASPVGPPRSAPIDDESIPTLSAAIEALERRLFEEGLARTGGNRTRLARELDISRTTLNERLRRFGLG
jgi:DNA-binding NtrC family response regulator